MKHSAGIFFSFAHIQPSDLYFFYSLFERYLLYSQFSYTHIHYSVLPDGIYRFLFTT